MQEHKAYPEQDLLGFTRHDGTVHFYSRVQAMVLDCARRLPATTRPIVLDVGCGRGSGYDDSAVYRGDLRRFDYSTVIGIDLERHKDNPFIDEFRRITNPSLWPVAEASIDLVLSDYVLEHIKYPSQFWREVSRVLKPGGMFAIRTPNRWCYPCIAAQIVPNRLHHRWVRRDAADVFPTWYRCNTRRAIRKQMARHGLRGTAYTIEAEPSYFKDDGLAYRLMSHVHEWLPRGLRSTLIVLGKQ